MLIPNVVSDNFCRYFVANRTNKVTIIPEFPSPELFLDLGKLSEHHLGRYTFDPLHNYCGSKLRRHDQKQVYMIFHYFHRVYFQIVLFGYLPKNLFQSF